MHSCPNFYTGYLPHPTIHIASTPAYFHARPVHSTIKARHLVDIRAFSAVESEEELLLLPGTALVVKSVLNAGNGLILIQLEEDLQSAPLLDFLHPDTRFRLASATEHKTDSATGTSN